MGIFVYGRVWRAGHYYSCIESHVSEKLKCRRLRLYIIAETQERGVIYAEQRTDKGKDSGNSLAAVLQRAGTARGTGGRGNEQPPAACDHGGAESMVSAQAQAIAQVDAR